MPSPSIGIDRSDVFSGCPSANESKCRESVKLALSRNHMFAATLAGYCLSPNYFKL